MIAHPPCTYLSNVSTRAFSLRCTAPEKVVDRWQNRARAAIFFMQFEGSPIEHIAVENPVGFMNANYRKPTQIIHPYQFAESADDSENYVTKRTCLWLKGLPQLRTNDIPKPDNRELYGVYDNGKAKCWEDTAVHGGVARSKTFPGIAKAMAEQWSEYLMNEARKE